MKGKKSNKYGGISAREFLDERHAETLKKALRKSALGLHKKKELQNINRVWNA